MACIVFFSICVCMCLCQTPTVAGMNPTQMGGYTAGLQCTDMIMAGLTYRKVVQITMKAEFEDGCGLTLLY